MENLKIIWVDDIYNSLKRQNEEINEGRLVKIRGKKLPPRGWIVETWRSYHRDGSVTLCFRLPNSILWNDTNGDYSDNTMDLLREEIVSVFPNLCNDVVFTENIHLYRYLTFDNRTDIEYNLNYLCQAGLM